jgi:hypothetical protein
MAAMFIFSTYNQQYDTLLPIPLPCTHKLKAGIAYSIPAIVNNF